MKLKFLTLFSILALAASVFAESVMSNITVNLRYTGKNGAAKKFAEEMVSSGTVAKIRAEKGNIRYEYFQSLDDPETILLIDAWESQAAIDVHHASPMMKTIAKLRDKYDLKMTAERFTPDNTMPKTDEKFIRKQVAKMKRPRYFINFTLKNSTFISRSASGTILRSLGIS